MPEYLVTVEARAIIRETWRVRADTEPTPEEAAELIGTGDADHVSDATIGDEERDYSTVKVEGEA